MSKVIETSKETLMKFSNLIIYYADYYSIIIIALIK